MDVGGVSSPIWKICASQIASFPQGSHFFLGGDNKNWQIHWNYIYQVPPSNGRPTVLIQGPERSHGLGWKFFEIGNKLDSSKWADVIQSTMQTANPNQEFPYEDYAVFNHIQYGIRGFMDGKFFWNMKAGESWILVDTTWYSGWALAPFCFIKGSRCLILVSSRAVSTQLE